MFRKVTFALVAAASLGVAALSTTSASAMPLIWPHHHHHWHPGVGIGLGFLAGGYAGCYQQRLVPTPFGYRWRTVNVCVY